MAKLSLFKWSLATLPPFTAYLGWWQLDRLKWKDGIIAELERKQADEPFDLMTIQSLDDLKDKQYRKVKMLGTYNHNRQLYLRPRQLVHNSESISRGYSPQSTFIGKHVVTAFTLKDTDLTVLVNRGWLPEQETSNVPDDTCQEVTGVLKFSTNLTDVETMSKLLKTAPIYIEDEEHKSRKEGPIGGQTRLSIRNEHLNYAITWFLLSICGAYIWYTGIYKGKPVFGSKLFGLGKKKQ